MSKNNVKVEEKLQWHPAFYAGLQIELKDERDNLIFESEHNLGTKPKQIDVLIIKKQKDIPIRKNIGKIFRKYNIVEYKSPTDYLGIDDYYKCCAYAYFYKSDTGKENQILIEELTLTFVSFKYPRRLISHLKEVLGYDIIKKEEGIYYVKKGNDILPQQFIVTSKLKSEENIWLRGLTNNINSLELAQSLVHEYEKNKKDGNYSVPS